MSVMCKFLIDVDITIERDVLAVVVDVRYFEVGVRNSRARADFRSPTPRGCARAVTTTAASLRELSESSWGLAAILRLQAV